MNLELIEAVARRSLDYPYRVWGFGEGMALLGILRVGELLHRGSWIDDVADQVMPALGHQVKPTDHLIPVEVLMELRRLRPGVDIAAAVHRFVNATRQLVHRPDLAELHDMIWVDCLHTDGPGLMLTGDKDAAVDAVERAAALLQDASGLFSHGYRLAAGQANGVHWGRGQGWALHGLVAVESPRLTLLLEALAASEVDGAWRTIVDDPAAPIEHSVSALIASAQLPASWRSMQDRALRHAIAALDADGGLPVSSATPVGDRATYVERDIGVFPWGQGPLLLALLGAP